MTGATTTLRLGPPAARSGAVALVALQSAAAALLTVPGLVLALALARAFEWFGMRTPDATWNDGTLGTGLAIGGGAALLVLGATAAVTAALARAAGLRVRAWIVGGAITSCVVASVAVAIGLLAA